MTTYEVDVPLEMIKTHNITRAAKNPNLISLALERAILIFDLGITEKPIGWIETVHLEETDGKKRA